MAEDKKPQTKVVIVERDKRLPLPSRKGPMHEERSTAITDRQEDRPYPRSNKPKKSGK